MQPNPFLAPTFDEPQSQAQPLGWDSVEGGCYTAEAWDDMTAELERDLGHLPSPSFQSLLDDRIPY